MSEAELDWLRSAARQSESIAEIGCWKGRSTHALLEACPGPVYAVDHWRGSRDELDAAHHEARTGDIYGQFVKNVGHFSNLVVVRADSCVAARRVPDVDMVFIDGCHLKEDVLADIEAWRPKTRVLMCGHDIGYASVYQAVMEALGEFQIGVGSIWVVKFKESPIETRRLEEMKAKCKHCGFEQDAEALVCWSCGQDPGTQAHAQQKEHAVEETHPAVHDKVGNRVHKGH